MVFEVTLANAITVLALFCMAIWAVLKALTLQGEKRVLERFDALHRFSFQSEQEEIIFSYLFSNLNICPVQRADCQCAIQCQFHIACSRSFFSCCRDLFRQIGRRENQITIFDAVIWEEDDL